MTRRAKEAFPWTDAMGFAFGTLRLSSEAFWAMTPRELSIAIRAVTGGVRNPALPRGELARLMQAFPDKKG